MAALAVKLHRYLDALPGDTAAEPIIRELLERAAGRLRLLCANLLYRSYPRLTRPPLNLETDELLSSLVTGLLTALRTMDPTDPVRYDFSLCHLSMMGACGWGRKVGDAQCPLRGLCRPRRTNEK